MCVVTNFTTDDEILKKSAQEIFTDRTEPQDAFMRAYNTIDSYTKNGKPARAVLNFYGVGGIGKTELVNRLENILPKAEDTYTVRYSFRNSTASVKDIIESMARLLIDNHKFDFPVLAYALLRLFVLEGGSYNIAPETFTNNVEDNPVIGTVAAVVKCFTPFGDFIALVQDLLSIKNSNQENKYNKILRAAVKDDDGKKLLAKNDSSSAEEIKEEIHIYFVHDLKKTIAEKKKPLVIFFDTYEHYVDKIRNSYASSNDEWIRYMIRHIPGVLWVITGRERLLKIDENDPWKEMEVEEHRLDRLSETDQREYFVKMAEISEPELVDHFISISEGIPFVMDLCYSTYVKLKNNNENYKDPTLYGKNQNQILLKYFELMDHDTKNLFIDLAIVEGGWSDDLIKTLKKDFSEYYDYERYNLLCAISLVTKDDANRYSIPEVVRRAILQKEPIERIEKIRTVVSQYYLDKHKKESNLAPADSIIKCVDNKIQNDLSYEFYKANIHDALYDYSSNYRFEDSMELISRFDNKLENLDFNTRAIFLADKSFFFVKSGKYREGLEIVQTEFDFLDNHVRNDDSKFWLFTALYRILSVNGSFEQALKYCTKSYDLALNLYGEKHIESLRTLYNLYSSYIDIGNYREALEYGLKCYELRKSILGEEHPDTLVTMNKLAYNYRHLGDYQEALEYDLKCYELRKSILGEAHPDTLTSMDGLAVDYKSLGDDYKALEYDLKCYELRKSILGEAHPDTLTSMDGLASDYKCLGDDQKALEYDLKCYELRKSTLGEEHPDTMRSLYDLLTDYITLEDYQKILEYDLKYYELMKATLGEEHPDTLAKINDLACDYANLDDYQKALEYDLKCYELRKSTLGEEHPDTMRSLYGLSADYRNLGDYQKALEYSLKCYKLRKSILGEESPYTLTSMLGLAEDYRCLGYYQEAIEYGLKCYELSKSILGEEHPDTLTSMFGLAVDYSQLGDYQKALEYGLKCYELMKATLGEESRETERVKTFITMIQDFFC